MAPLEILQVPALEDNYIYLLHEKEKNVTAAVDPAVKEPVLGALQKTGWALTHILNTHHHWDHTGGNLDLKAETGCTIVGSAVDAERIPGIDIGVNDGEEFRFGASSAKVLLTPGHTRGHICYWFKADQALFCGDTLFTAGCGRVFEGTYEQMWASLDRLRQLPDETKVYCGHEYTLKNLRFALRLEPNNEALQARLRNTEELRQQNRSTVPATMAIERATNPFLRPDSPAIREALGLEAADHISVFAATREQKDRF